MKEEKPMMGHGVRFSNGLMTKKKNPIGLSKATNWVFPKNTNFLYFIKHLIFLKRTFF